MTTTSSILSLPFRRSNHLSLASTIRQYINSKYDQHPDMFRHDLEAIDSLRRDAVNVSEAHPSGINKLQAYAAQLVWIGGKFPIDIGAEFTWYPAFGHSTDRPIVRNNLKFELMNILFNLAALYSQLAVNMPRLDTEGLKNAAHYFSLAAGILSHIQTSILPELRMSDPPEDMDTHTLESLMQVLLAQSQECFWQKAVKDGYKDASIAKLAARVSDLYNLAADAAIKSEVISSAWIHHVTAKHHHYAAAAQYRAACACLEEKKYGEEVARLKDAVACITKGLKETRGGYLSKMVVEDLNNLKRKVEEDVKRAEKDNDMIFLDVVPPKSELKILERANLAIARTPPQVSAPYDFFGDETEFGPALFSRLVPFSVHVAISIYEERRDRMVNQEIVQELEALTQKIHTTLAELGLPGSLQALEKPMGLPPSLVQHAEEVRQADAIARLQKSFADIDKLRSADLATFEEGKSALTAEQDEDQHLRRRFGTDRWARPDSQSDPQGTKLWSHANEIEGYFQSSISSDGVVREKFGAIEDVLRILSGSDRGLMDYVPASRQKEIGEDLRPAVGRLRSAYNDTLRLESRRRKKTDSLRESARRDDIKPDIVKEAARLERTYPTTALVPAHFEDFFEKRLDRLYEPEIEAVAKEAQEQDRLLTNVERANREFEAQKRKGGGRGHRDREQALQRLDNAYFKYKEIVNNLEVGRKFYNDLSKIVGQGFRDVVKGWVAQRRMEARALEEELNMPPLSNLHLSQNHTPVHSPPAASYQPGQQSYFSAAPHQVPPHQLQQPPPPPHQQQQQQPQAGAIQSWAATEGRTQAPQAQSMQPGVTRPPGSNMGGGHPAEEPAAGGTWNPSMGITFGGTVPSSSQPQQSQQAGQPSQTWNPTSGIRFG